MPIYKVPYVCGPITELPKKMREPARYFYVRIADLCEKEVGARAYVPHEHLDTVMNPNLPFGIVNQTDRVQVIERTSLLIVVTFAASWGGGIEVGWADLNGVPAIILRERGKKVSRLLLENPAIVGVIDYVSLEDALSQLGVQLAGYLEASFS